MTFNWKADAARLWSARHEPPRAECPSLNDNNTWHPWKWSQGAAPAAVEVTLGSLEVQPVSLQGASAWFKQQVQAQQRNQQHQFREVR